MAAFPEKVTESAATEPLPPRAMVLVWLVMVPVSDEIATETFDDKPAVLVTVLP